MKEFDNSNQSNESQEESLFYLIDQETDLDEIPKKPIKRVLIIIAVVILVLIIGFFAVKLLLNKNNGKNLSVSTLFNNSSYYDANFKFPDGIYINEIPIGGLTLEEAETKITGEQEKYVPTFKLNIIANKKTYTFSETDFKFNFNTKQVLQSAKDYSDKVRNGIDHIEQTKRFDLNYLIDKDSISEFVDSFARKVNTKPKNSTFKVYKENHSFSFTKGQNGYSIKKKDLIEQLTNFFSSDMSNNEIIAKMSTKNPKISSDELEGNITRLSTFSTISTNTANGNANMKQAFKSCNGSIIEPGEIWSFNKCTGNSSLTSNGYLPATIISGGQYTTGIGGGICQSSTTIYNAALYADLNIVERRSHYWASTYCKEGFDASINYSNVDLKLKNNSEYPVYLECYMEGNKLTANFYGRQSDEYDDIKLSSKRTSYVEGSHYDVSAKRSWYKNGKLVKSENLTSSRYSLKSKNTVISSSKKKPTSKKPTSSKASTSSKKPTTSIKPTSSKPTSSRPTSSRPASSEPTSSNISSSENSNLSQITSQ